MAHLKYGWKRDLPDPRDHLFALSRTEQTYVLPTEFSLRDKMPPVYDQGQLGSCTANSIGACVQYQQMRQKEAEGQNIPSRLFIYYNERSIEGTVSQDSGAQIRDGMKVIGTYGAPAESEWPYDISKFANKPPQNVYDDAKKFTATYGRVTQSAHSLQASIFFKRPVVFGFTVFESFESQQVASTGIMPMPDLYNEQVLGGHAVMTMGWKPINGQLHFEVRNSWGSGWGDEGYFWMPAQYIVDSQLASDFWHVDVTT